MPPLEEVFLTAEGVFWPVLRFDGYGEPVISDSPIPVKLYWSDMRSELTDSRGSRVKVEGEIMFVDRRITTGSLVALGNIGLLSDVGTGNVDELVELGLTSEIMQVVKVEAEPSIDGDAVLYTAKVRRYRGTLPEGQT